VRAFLPSASIAVTVMWLNKYGCSIEQLRAAVTAVGNVAADVESTSSLLAIPVLIAPRSEKHSAPAGRSPESK
jgi:hypothetical protein